MNVVKLFSLSIVVVLNFCCTSSLYQKTNKAYKNQVKKLTKEIRALPNNVKSDSLRIINNPSPVFTTNFGMRKPNMVIIHYTAQKSCEQTYQTFTKPATQVSAHYVICKDGTVTHMLNDYLRAWHAGAGKWGNNADINSSSIGIEIDNNGVDSFTTAQLNSLYNVLAFTKKEYAIPSYNFIGHSDIAPTRKTDPGKLFPWKTLAEKGFGIWYSDTTNLIVPENFSVAYALKIIGYDIKNLEAATLAFKLHFLQTDVKGILNKNEEKVLYAVLLKFL